MPEMVSYSAFNQDTAVPCPYSRVLMDFGGSTFMFTARDNDLGLLYKSLLNKIRLNASSYIHHIITNAQFPITNSQLPITNYQLPITNYQLPFNQLCILIEKPSTQSLGQ